MGGDNDDFEDELPDESGPLPADDDGEEEQDEQDEERKAPTTPAPPPEVEVGGQRLVKKQRPGKRHGGKPKPPIGGKKDSRRGPPVQLNEVGLAALKRKRGEGGVPAGIPSKEADAEVARSTDAGGWIDPGQEPTRELVVRWPLVLELLQQQGLDPSAVAIRVYVTTQGPYALPPAIVGTIDGRSVMGGGDLSPGDAIRDYVENCFHSVMQKPAKYEGQVYYKVTPSWRPKGGSMICNGYLELPAYDAIVQQRQRQAEWLRRNPSQGVGAPMPSMPTMPNMPAMGPAQPPPLAPNVLQTLQAMGYQVTPIGGGGQAVGANPPPAGPSFSEEVTRELLGRMLRGEPIGPQAPAPVVIPAPAAVAPQVEMPHVPTIKEQLQTVAELIALVDKIRPPATPATAPAVGVGRAPRASDDPLDPLAGFKGALKMIREVTNLKEELAEFGLGAAGGSENEEAPAKEDPPFSVMEIPGGIKWPHGKNLSRIDQIQQFLMLNPDVSLKVVQGLSRILDQSAFAQVLQFMAQRGNPNQQAVAQAMGVGQPARPQSQPPSQPPGPSMPPVIRPPAMNGAPQVAAPPAPPEPDEDFQIIS